MQRHRISIYRLSFGFAVLAALGACGDTLGEQAVFGAGAGGAAAVALDVNILTGAAVGVATNMAYCSRYPSRC
jgi:osmotically inducible lipoprotein OsmB